MTTSNSRNSSPIFLLAFPLLFLCLSSDANDGQKPAYSDLEKQKKALDYIASFADSFCTKVITDGAKKQIVVTGSAKAEANKLIKLLAKLKIEGAANYIQQNYTGVPREHLLEALRDSTRCRLAVWEDLQQKLIPKSKTPVFTADEPYAKFINHSYAQGKIPNGYSCTNDNDCKPSPNMGYCYPGPPNNEVSYCQDSATNCAFPGSSGTMYGTMIQYLENTYECYYPGKNRGKARWRLVE